MLGLFLPSFPLGCACGVGVGGGSRLDGKVSLSEKVVLVLPAIEVGAIKASSRSYHHGVPHHGVPHQAACHQGVYYQGRFWILLSRLVSSRWTLGCVIKAGVGSLQAVRSGGSEKVWRWQQALEAKTRASSSHGRKPGRRQQGLGTRARYPAPAHHLARARHLAPAPILFVPGIWLLPTTRGGSEVWR